LGREVLGDAGFCGVLEVEDWAVELEDWLGLEVFVLGW
jgi:hypothetical protein